MIIYVFYAIFLCLYVLLYVKNIVPLLKEIKQRVKESKAKDDDAGKHTEDNLINLLDLP
jgi:hypothetical protein